MSQQVIRDVPDQGLSGSLLKNPSFVRLWVGDTIAQFGAQITLLTLPLIAVLTFSASPWQMGLLSAAMTAPSLLIGLFVGVWVDRMRRRPLLVIADLGRAITLMVIPALWMLDSLSVFVLFGVAIALGVGNVIFDVAYISFLPSLVRRDQLIEGNSKLEISASAAQVGGPAIAGVLTGWLGGPLVLAASGIAYLCSGALIQSIRNQENVPVRIGERTSMWLEMREGLSIVRNNRILGSLVLSSATLQFSGWMFLAVYVIYMANHLGLSAGQIGMVFAAGGVGAIIGATFASRIAKRLGPGATVVWATAAFGLGGLLVPGALLIPQLALPLVVACELLQWMALVVANVSSRSIRQVLTPDRLLGRVNATYRVLVSGMVPIGSLVGGLLGEIVGVPATLVIGVFGMLVAFLWLIPSPMRSFNIEEAQ
jgi:MFS family permease